MINETQSTIEGRNNVRNRLFLSVAAYLVLVITVCSFGHLSPWAHRVLEHSLFEKHVPHVHAVDDLPNGSASHHRHDDHDHSSEDSADAPHPTDHDHHGLPDWIANGLLDVADATISLPGRQATFSKSDSHFSALLIRHPFDPVQAPRPPPSSSA